MAKVTINAVDNLVSNLKEGDLIIHNGQEEPIVIRTNYTLTEAETVIKRVSNAVVSGEDYHPAATIPVFVITVLQMFSNANVPMKKIEINGEKTSVLDLDKASEWANVLYREIVDNKNFLVLEGYCEDKIQYLLEERKKDTVMNRFFNRLSMELDRMQEEHDYGVIDTLKAMTVGEKE